MITVACRRCATPVHLHPHDHRVTEAEERSGIFALCDACAQVATLWVETDEGKEEPDAS